MKHGFRLATTWMLILWTCSAGQAQVTFGVFGGLNYTALSDVEFASGPRALYESRSGYNIGGFIDMASGGFAFRPGLSYVNAGRVFENGLSQVADVSDNFDLRYFVVPVDMRIRMDTPVVKPYILFGPALRFIQDDDVDQDFRPNLRTFNVSGSVGAGVEVGAGAVRLLPEIRFAFDLSGLTGDTLNVRGLEFRADDEHRSRAVVLRLGLAF